MKLAADQPRQQLAHALPNRQRFTLDRVMAEQVGAPQYITQRQQHFAQIDRWRQAHDSAIADMGADRSGVALHPRQRVDVFGSFLEALVFLPAAKDRKSVV